MATKKILLTRTAVVNGKHYLPDPDKIYEFDAKIADELVDKNAAEPVMDLPGGRQENDTDDPSAGLKSNLKKKNR
ncbi:hypothetical protein [Desulfotignum balticum]|uniref:hypothetical protein n=1 Tax=Desulfotignum balticum TaxID=115781 RepID=UPI000555140C|nr:hypothetical protein [Desulfotignum balticum]